MGVADKEKGIGALGAYKKDHVSWREVIRQARGLSYSPERVRDLISAEWHKHFYGNTDFKTFGLCAIYHEQIKKLKKGEKPYAAQTWVMQHYPDLVAVDMREINKQLKTAKGYRKKTLSEKHRSKRNTISNKYKRILSHPSWDRYITKFYPSDILRKEIRRFYVR